MIGIGNDNAITLALARRFSLNALASSRVLLYFGSAVFSSSSFLLAHICAALCGPVAFSPSEVVDPWRVKLALVHDAQRGASPHALNSGLLFSGDYQTAKAYSFPPWVAQVAPFLEQVPGQSLSRLRLQPPICCALGPRSPRPQPTRTISTSAARCLEQPYTRCLDIPSLSAPKLVSCVSGIAWDSNKVPLWVPPF
jgi:hypothetical protein